MCSGRRACRLIFHQKVAKKEVTLDDQLITLPSRVTSVNSWYLASLVNLSFLDLAPLL